MELVFEKKWIKLGNFNIDLENIEEEKMFILSELSYVKENCSKNGVTEKFLKYFELNIFPQFNNKNKIWEINSKIHRLRKGWIPAIGNWHLDNIDRGNKTVYENGVEIKDKIGQPDYNNLHEDIFILYVIGESARTQLINCDVSNKPPIHEWKGFSLS